MDEIDPVPRLFERLTSDRGTELLITLRLARGRALTPRARRLLLPVEKLAASVREAGDVEVTTAVLHVWAYVGRETRTVDVHVRRLRRKLGLYGSLIDTVRGVGYRLDGSARVVIV